MKPSTQREAMAIWAMKRVVSMERENMVSTLSMLNIIMIPLNRMSHFSCFSACS
jgi:hypothetical protein